MQVFKVLSSHSKVMLWNRDLDLCNMQIRAFYRHQWLCDFIGNTSNQGWICRGIMKPCPFLLSLISPVRSRSKTPLEPICREDMTSLHFFILFSILSVVAAVSFGTLWGVSYEKLGLCVQCTSLNTSRARIIITLFAESVLLLLVLYFVWLLGHFYRKTPEKYWIVSLCILLL